MLEYYRLHQAVDRLSGQPVVDPCDAQLRFAVCDVVGDSLTRFCRRFEEESPSVDFVSDMTVTVQAGGSMLIAGEAYLFTDDCRGHSVHSFVIKVYGDRF